MKELFSKRAKKIITAVSLSCFLCSPVSYVYSMNQTNMPGRRNFEVLLSGILLTKQSVKMSRILNEILTNLLLI